MPVLVLMGLLFAAGCFLGTVAVWVFTAPVLLAPPDKFTLALSTTSLPVDQRRQNGVQDDIEMFAHVFRQESQDQISVLLQESILSAIPPVGLGVSQVLGSVQFDGHTGVRAKQIDFHPPAVVEGYW